jgi:hypothetical protein
VETWLVEEAEEKAAVRPATIRRRIGGPSSVSEGKRDSEIFSLHLNALAKTGVKEALCAGPKPDS